MISISSKLLLQIQSCFPSLKKHIIFQKAKSEVTAEDLYHMYEQLHLWVAVSLLSDGEQELYYTFIRHGISNKSEMADFIIREYWKTLQ